MKRPALHELDWRVSLGGGVALLFVALLVLGLQQGLLLLALMFIVGGAAVWLVVGISNATASVIWNDYRKGVVPSSGPDRRVQLLRARLRGNAQRNRPTITRGEPRTEPVDDIVASLIAVIDDHLLSDHEIDRSLDPASAARVLGPDLTRFVTDPSAARSMTRRRSLGRTLTLIEHL